MKEIVRELFGEEVAESEFIVSLYEKFNKQIIEAYVQKEVERRLKNGEIL